MILKLALRALILGSCMGPLGAQVPSIRPIAQAPQVAWVECSPRNPDVIVVGYRRPLLPIEGQPCLALSIDGGASFAALDTSQTVLADEPIRDIELSPSGMLYVASSTTVLRSRDRGVSFEVIWTSTGAQEPIGDLAVDPFDSERIWMATSAPGTVGSAYVRSEDGGSTWSAVPSFVPGDVGVSRALLFDQLAPDSLVRVTARHVVHSSRDGVEVRSVHPISGTVQSDGWVLVGGRLLRSESGSTRNRLRESFDYGATWSDVAVPAGPLWGLAQDPLTPQHIVYITGGERFASSDGGATWESTGAGAFDPDRNGAPVVGIVPGSAALGSAASSTLLVGSFDGLVVTPANEDRPLGVALPSGQKAWGFPEISRSSPWDLIDGDGRGGAISRDQGQTWQLVAYPTGVEGEFWTGPGGRIYVSAETGPLRSIVIEPDGTFTTSSGPLTVADGAPAVRVQGTDNQLLLSTDGGATYSVVYEEEPANGLFVGRKRVSGQVRSTPGGIEILCQVYWDTFGGELSYLLISRDAGASWAFVPVFPTIQPGLFAMGTWDEVNPEVVYVASNSATYPTFRSRDGGRTWSAVGQPGVHRQILRSPIDPEIVLRGPVPAGAPPAGPPPAGGASSMLTYELSRDGGQTWTDLDPMGEFLAPGAAFSPDGSFAVCGGWLVEFGEELGAQECVANLNSTGRAASIHAIGSGSVARGDVVLAARDLPAFTFGLFSTSRNAGFVPLVAGSEGNLCLSGPIGRLGPMPRQASASGVMTLRLDTGQIPQGNRLIPIVAGETWRFEAWFRDGGTSNRSNAVAVEFGG